jgi:hypothetical protein
MYYHTDSIDIIKNLFVIKVYMILYLYKQKLYKNKILLKLTLNTNRLFTIGI